MNQVGSSPGDYSWAGGRGGTSGHGRRAAGVPRPLQAFIMPKYTLSFALDRPHDMAAAMQLALASSTDEVYEACKDPETG
eukprot:160558-Pyramimonas_sp.AAC.1